MQEKIELYVGTYDARGGEGLLTLSLCDGDFTAGETDRRIKNASFFSYSARRDLYYALDEQDAGVLRVLKYAAGHWSVLSSCSTRGSAPCFVALNSDESAVAVANYYSGSVVTFPIDIANGLVVDDPIVWSNRGSGPNRSRQDGPHAHCSIFRGARLYSTDLGTDEVLLHLGSASNLTRTAFAPPPGEGPRHILFHPTLPVAYLLTELGSKIFALVEGEEGLFFEMQRVSTLPHSFAGSSKAAHLMINAAGNRLYASNRGHDSIAVFSLDPDGKLTLEQIAKAGGAAPRSLLLLENQHFLLAANEDGDCISVLNLARDGAIGVVKRVLPVRGASFVGKIGAT